MKKRISFVVTSEMKKQIEALASKSQRSLSSALRMLLAVGVKSYQARVKK